MLPTGLAFDNPDLLTTQVSNPTVVFVTSASTIQLAGSITDLQPDTLVVTKRTAATTTATSTATLNAAFAASTIKPILTLKDANNDFNPTPKTTLEKATTAGESRVSTTLAEASIAGATTIKVASASGLVAGEVLKIDERGRKEFKKIASISGDTVTLGSALSRGHASGVPVVEQETITVVANSGFTADKFIQIDKGANGEVRRITFSTAASSTMLALDSALSNSHAAGAPVRGAENRTFRSTQAISLDQKYNQFTATLTDKGNQTTTVTVVVLRDNTAPTWQAKVVTIVSDGEAKVGDQLFLLVSAGDGESEVSSVTEVAANADLVPVANVEDILLEMHNLRTISPSTTTHVRLSQVAAGTPVGVNSISVKIKDTAENEATISASLTVVSARTNRNYRLFAGNNFVGLGLIPDNASLDAQMDQDITAFVNPAFAASHTHVGHATVGLVTLGDIIDSTVAFSGGAAGVFLKHSPGPGSADTLTEMKPFQGMIIKVKETGSSDVFKKVDVTGFTAKQAVPINMNIQGVFFKTGEFTPPEKKLTAGYNLTSPHILGDTTFDRAYRGALIPAQLIVSAITFERRVDAIAGTSSIGAEIFEGFDVASLGDIVKPVLSYWNFIVSGEPTLTPD